MIDPTTADETGRIPAATNPIGPNHVAAVTLARTVCARMDEPLRRMIGDRYTTAHHDVGSPLIAAELERLMDERDAAVAVLKDAEWDGRYGCPVCLCWRSKGHSPDCSLAAAIRKATGGQGA